MKAFIDSHATHADRLPATWSHRDTTVALTIECPCGVSHVSTYSGDVQVTLADGSRVPIQSAPYEATVIGLSSATA